MGKLRVGVIGAGGIVAKLHLPEMAAIPDFEVALLSGRKESRLRLLCEKFNVPKYTHSYEDVIADDSIDAIVIATPHPDHVSWGLKALAAGKHILMQKPLCGDMAEADAFVAAAEKSDRIVFCLPHFRDMLWTLRRRIREGEIGKISGARCRTSHGGPEIYYAEVSEIFGESAQGKDLWFFDSKRAGVGALFDMGVYAVSALVALLGSVKRVTGFTGTFDKPTDLEDVATLVLQLENGALATAETSWCDPARTSELSVHGTSGKFVSGVWADSAVKWTPTSYTREDAPPKSEPLAPDTGVGNLHAHFLDCVRNQRQSPLSNVHAARHVTEIMLAGLESSRSGRAVEIESKCEGV